MWRKSVYVERLFYVKEIFNDINSRVLFRPIEINYFAFTFAMTITLHVARCVRNLTQFSRQPGEDRSADDKSARRTSIREQWSRVSRCAIRQFATVSPLRSVYTRRVPFGVRVPRTSFRRSKRLWSPSAPPARFRREVVAPAPSLRISTCSPAVRTRAPRCCREIRWLSEANLPTTGARTVAHRTEATLASAPIITCVKEKTFKMDMKSLAFLSFLEKNRMPVL